MKESYYFSHDYNARNDIKIKRLLLKHGMTGYGVFWSIIEELYNNANALPLDYETYAYELRVSPDVIKSVINDYDLFVINDEQFGSMSVQNRLNERDKKSKKARDNAYKRWNKSEGNANAMQTHSEGNAIKERKGKEKKGKDKILKDNKEKDSSIDCDFEILEYPSFDDFWELYDKKVDKVATEKKWGKLTQEEKEQAIEYIPQYKLSEPDKTFRKNPLTFINNKSWNNEIITKARSGNDAKIPLASSFTPEDFGM